MDKLERKKSFIVKLVYIALWAVIIYCLLKYAMPLFMPFVIAYFIGFLLKPLINLITRKAHLPRKLVAVVCLILLYCVIGTLIGLGGVKVVGWVIDWVADLPVLYRETVEPALASLSNSLEGFFIRPEGDMKNFLETVGQSLSNAISSILSSLSGWAVGFVTNAASGVPWAVVSTFLCIISSFYFVVDYRKITDFFVMQLPEGGKHKLMAIRDFIFNVLFRFVRAYGILMSITFVEVSIGLLILQVPNAFLIALLIAIVDILPVLGTGTVMLPWAVISLINENYFLGIGLIVLYAVITIIRQVIEPRVVGSQIGLYPLLTLLCMFIGARLFGFVGMLGLPVTLTLIIYLNRSGEISLFKEHGDDYPPPGPDQPKKRRKWGKRS